MLLDKDLRMSYRNNDHQFHNNLMARDRDIENKQDLLNEINERPKRFKLCKKCKKKIHHKVDRYESNDSDSLIRQKSTIKIDKSQTVYDEQEIDFINDNQNKVYISFVEVNPYLKFGIRAHYKDLTAAHCLHSMFDIFHRDFLLMWIYFLPGLFMLWEYISLQLNISHLFKGTQNFSLVH